MRFPIARRGTIRLGGRPTILLALTAAAAVAGRVGSVLAQEPGAPATEVIAGQPSWVVTTPNVRLAVTRLGGHMAPVTFARNTGAPVQPYHISPWQEENLRIDVPVLVPLRGDFFCMPFGGNTTPFDGERHPPHGEVAGSPWNLEGFRRRRNVSILTLSMEPRVRRGKVTKELMLVDGENVVYSRHVLEGFSGPMPLGHHATLRLPDEPGALLVSTSPIRFGMTNPTLFSDPEQREYQSLAIGHRFRDLRRVATLWKNPARTDCSAYPARTGFADLFGLFARPSPGTPAWVAAVEQRTGYLWFALKDPDLLPTTLFWVENRGRHGPPWNGRNRCLGLEDVRAYFAYGLAESARPNLLTRAGIPTALELSRDRPTVVPYIQGAVRVEPGFGRVRQAEFAPGRVVFTSDRGRRAEVAVRHEFVFSGRL